MKQNGFRTICTACCVIILCCNYVPSCLGWKLMDRQEGEAMQSHRELLPRLTSSRIDELKLLSLLLQQHSAHGGGRVNAGNSQGLNPNQVSSNVISREVQADDELEAGPEKRQRPCFWSVVTCY